MILRILRGESQLEYMMAPIERILSAISERLKGK